MSRSEDAPTPEELAVINAQRDRADIHTTIAGEQPPLSSALIAPVRQACLAMQRLGIIPRGDLGFLIPTLPDAIFGYALAVGQLALAEDAQGTEFDIALHVTHDPVLLRHADALQSACGTRPVTVPEMAARVDTAAAAYQRWKEAHPDEKAD